MEKVGMWNDCPEPWNGAPTYGIAPQAALSLQGFIPCDVYSDVVQLYTCGHRYRWRTWAAGHNYHEHIMCVIHKFYYDARAVTRNRIQRIHALLTWIMDIIIS